MSGPELSARFSTELQAQFVSCCVLDFFCFTFFIFNFATICPTNLVHVDFLIYKYMLSTIQGTRAIDFPIPDPTILRSQVQQL